MERIEKRVREIAEASGADKMLVLTDRTVDGLTRDLFQGVPRLVVEPGEGSKSLEGAQEVWRFLEENNAVRRTLLVNIGGGMISDLGGFAASTFKRGIPCVNLPTTLLAAVDAAIGGKTGINFNGLKNEIGTFSMPLDVLPLTDLFGHLDDQEWLSGAGEAIKTGLLDSESLFELAVSREFIVERRPEVVREVVERCAAFKKRIVEEDFREGGPRKILNLGHTAGHAIEALVMSRGGHIPHGVAVAHGLLFTLEKSVAEAGLDKEVLDRYAEVVGRYFPPVNLDEADLKAMEGYMARDKKNTEEGKVNWVLLEEIGKPVV